MSTRASWDEPMRLALAEAQAALAGDDVPVGAVVLDEAGTVIGTGRNTRESDGDPTGHAEVVALRAAAERTGHWNLEGCTLVVTLEPCLMCAGALLQSRISRLVFGAWDDKAGAAVNLLRWTSPRGSATIRLLPADIENRICIGAANCGGTSLSCMRRAPTGPSTNWPAPAPARCGPAASTRPWCWRPAATA